ncbi:MAG TPA: hypothetical protein VLX61_07580 [Anaerolineales bacterium]|nr:hypothetical protein [Anaerolineales bacterium]
MNNRAKLLTKILNQGFRTPDWRYNQPPPGVTLEDFFEENPCKESIAPNFGDDHPGPNFFYSYWKEIRGHEDVEKVLVNIYDLSDTIFNKASGWPSTGNTHISTSAPREVVEKWPEELPSDGPIEGWPYGKPDFVQEAHGDFKSRALAWN